MGPMISLSLNERNPVQDIQSKPILDDDQNRVLEAVGFDPTIIDEIISGSGLKAEVVSANLAILEIAGLVTLETGGYYIRTTKEQD